MNSSTITSMFGIDSNNFKPTDIESSITYIFITMCFYHLVKFWFSYLNNLLFTYLKTVTLSNPYL